MSREGGPMATDLRERLTDLAEATPYAVPPQDLWDRGVRRRRRGRSRSALVVTAVVLALSLGGWAVRGQAQSVAPADSSGTAQVPETFYLPSPWMHAFDGPPGRLIALSGAWRQTSWFHKSLSLFGVTASSTRYGFLDIPGATDSGKSAILPLSPDGLHLAMWTGPDRVGTRQAYVPVTGIEVYDVQTGGLQRVRLPSSAGLAPSFLGWTDDRTLVVALRPVDASGATSGSTDRVYVWSSGDTALRPLTDPQLERLDWTESTAADGRLVVPGPNSSTWWVVDPLNPSSATRAVVHGTDNAQLFVSPDGRTAATIKGDGSPLSPSQIVTGGIASAPGTTASVSLDHVVPAGNFFNVVGWFDDSTLLASQHAPHNVQYESRLVKVDVRTGHVTPLVSPVGEHANIGETQFASELLGSPSVAVGPPSSPWDPWTLVGLSLLVAAGAGVAWWSLRGPRA
jgi:hypothetical protein